MTPGFVSVRIGEFNGDGNMDLLNNQVGPSYPEPYKFLLMNEDSKETSLRRIKDGLGSITEFDYTWLSKGENYSKGSPNQSDIRHIQSALEVVKELRLSNGIGGMSSTLYSYENAVMHKLGKGFLGFKKILTSSADQNRKTESTYAMNHDYFVMHLNTDKLSTYSGTQLKTSSSTYHYEDKGNHRYWSALHEKTTTDHVTGFVSKVENGYDSDGNLTLSSTQTGVGSPHNVTANRMYSNFVSVNGFNTPSLPERMQVWINRAGSGAALRITDFQYSASTGAVTQQIQDPLLDKTVITDFAHDMYGNILSETVSSSGLESRTTSYVYDDKGRFPISVTNSLGQTETFEYDGRWGTVTKATSVDGLTTLNDYDAFGRQVSTTDALGVTRTSTMEWESSVGDPSRYSVTTSTTGLPEATTYYDILGRAIRSEGEGFDQTLATSKSFDARGRLAESTSVSSSNNSTQPYVTIPSYNPVDQIQSVTDGEKTITKTYSSTGGLYETTTNETSHPDNPTLITRTDANGLVVYSQDAGGALTFEYDAYGNQTLVKDQQNNSLVVSTYDEYGRQRFLEDINGGTTEYQYDAFGQLVYQKDALGNETNIVYDVAGRIESKTVTGESPTTYEYVTTGNGLNKLKRVTAPNGTYTAYTYDAFGRPETVTEGIDGKTFTRTFTYTGNGQLATSSYPTESGTPLQLTYAYDQQMGATTGVSGNNGIGDLYGLGTVNALGGITEYTLGNGIVTTNTYNDRGQLTSSGSGNASNMTYTWNANTGALDERENPFTSFYEEFTHDELGRLTRSDVVDGPEPNQPWPIVVLYDNNGNITQKSDAGIYGYHDNKINAVNTITNEDETISLDEQVLTYTTTDRTATVDEGFNHIAYTYGPDDNRMKSVLTVNEDDGTEDGQWLRTETRYYLGNFEQLIIDHADGSQDKYELNYVTTGPGLVGIFVKHNEDAGTMFYTYTDHLGSITSLTDDQGNVVYRQSFDAWGRHRNPDNLTYDVDSYDQPDLPAGMPDPAVWLNRGYTGHEHMDEFDLVNMNNRMYDPKQGRMLAVDNFVQSPYSSQGYNRYSYVHNSPLSYVDPSGENGVGTAIQVAIAAVYAYLSGAKNNADSDGNWNWNPANWSQFQVGVAYGNGGLSGYVGFGDPNGISMNAGGNFTTGAPGGGLSGYGMPSYTQAPSAASFSIDWGGVDYWRGYEPMYYNFGAGIEYHPPGEGGEEIAGDGMVGFDSNQNPFENGDGYITYEEAYWTYRMGDGKYDLFADLDKLDLSKIHASDFLHGVGSKQGFNFAGNKFYTNPTQALVYGNITLHLEPNNRVYAESDKYDFDIKIRDYFGPKSSIRRDILTMMGSYHNGVGTPFMIHFRGGATIQP